MRTPGAWPSVAHRSVADGIVASFSAPNSEPILVDETSTTGDSAVTVTVSCSVATASWMSAFSVWPSARTMFSRRVVWKPPSSKVRV